MSREYCYWLLRKLAHLQEEIALGHESPENVWLFLNIFAHQGTNTRTCQLELFWDFYFDKEAELRAKCPYFDPQHEVWKESGSDESEQAMRELNHIMWDEKAFQDLSMVRKVLDFSSKLNLAAECVFCITFLVLGGNRYGLYLTALIFFVTIQRQTWALAFFMIAHGDYSFPNEAYAPVRNYSEKQTTPVSDVELQYATSWAATHNSRLRLHHSHVSDLMLWKELTDLVGGPIDSLGRYRIFIDSHLPAGASDLAQSSSIPATRGKELDNSGLETLDSLVIAPATRHIQKERRDLAIALGSYTFQLICIGAAFVVWRPMSTRCSDLFNGLCVYAGLRRLLYLVVVCCSTFSRFVEHRRELRDLIQQQHGM